MKKAFLIFLVVLISFVVVLGIIGLNLEYFLNQDFFKRRIQGYVLSHCRVAIDYKKIHLNLYKLKVEVENFRAKGKDFELYLPKGRILFSKVKIFRGNFYPSFVYLKNPYLLIKEVKEEEPFEIRKIYQYFYDLSPFTLWLNNGTFEYQLGDGRKFKIKDLNLLASDRAPQILFNGNATSSAFSFLDFKGRLNYRDQFFEGEARIKKLDLTGLKLKEIAFLKKTELDLSAEIALEKDFLNVGFSGQAPCLAFHKEASPWVCGFFQGYFTGNRDSFELKISPLDMKYPEVKGEIGFQKKGKEYLFEAEISVLSLDQIKELFSPHIDKKLLTEIFNLLKAGHFEELKIMARGESFHDLVNPQNLKLSGIVKEGELSLFEPPLRVSGIEGKLSFERGRLDFQGNALFDEDIFSKVKSLKLSLFEKKKTIGLSLDFDGKGKPLMEILKRFLKDKKPLEKIEVEGKIGGSLELSGDLISPEVSLTLRPKNTSLKTAYLKEPLILEEGELKYQKEQIFLRDLLVKYGESWGEGISGKLSLGDKDFSLKVSSFTLKEDFFQEILEKNFSLKEIFEKYQVGLETLKIKALSYEGNLERFEEIKSFELLDNLSFSGEVNTFSFKIPFNNGTFSFTSPSLKFSFSDHKITLFESKVSLDENSSLDLSGIYDLKEKSLTLKGGGFLSKEFLAKINPVKGKKLSLKDFPLELKTFEFTYSPKEGLNYKGRHFFQDLSLDINLTKGEALKISGKVLAEKNDFLFDTIKTKENLILSYEGRAHFEELSKLLEDPFLEGGTLKGKFRLSLNLSKMAEFEDLSLQSLPISMEKFLMERPIEGEGVFELEDLKIARRFFLSGEISLLSEGLKGKNLRLNFNNSTIKGDLALLFREKNFDLRGILYVENLNLKEALKEKETEEGPTLKKVWEKLPLYGEIKLEIAKTFLPTSHEIENLQARIIKEGKIFRVEVPEIRVCNLNLYGEYEKNPEFQYLFLDLKPVRGDFLDLFSCLYPEEMPRIIFEGPFKAQGFFYTDGERGLFENSYGRLEVISEKGYVYRAPLLARILGFLSPIDLFRGKIPDLERNLLPYEELNLYGEFRSSSLNVDTFFLSAPGFRLFGNGPISLKDKKISLTVLVSPFKTLDVVVEHLPFLNKWILGKERMFIYLPLEVVGTYDNPSIIPLHPASIGKGLFRFIFKFFGIQEEFFKKPETWEGFKKKELLKEKSGNSLRR